LVFPELLQNDVTVNQISQLGLELINNTEYKNNMNIKMNSINQKIGVSGASKRVAEFIIGCN